MNSGCLEEIAGDYRSGAGLCSLCLPWHGLLFVEDIREEHFRGGKVARLP